MSDLMPEKGFEPMPAPCEQEQNIRDIKLTVSELTTEIRGMIKEMREVFVEDREHRVRISANEKAIQVLFDRQRDMKIERDACLKEKIDPLVDWKNKADGGMDSYLQMKKDVGDIKDWKLNLQGSLNTIKLIPILCVVITTIIGLFTFVTVQHEKNDFNDHGLYHRDEGNKSSVGLSGKD